MLCIGPACLSRNQLSLGDHKLLFNVSHLRLRFNQLLRRVLDGFTLPVVAISDICTLFLSLLAETGFFLNFLGEFFKLILQVLVLLFVLLHLESVF
jgi:hypothetical protein